MISFSGSNDGAALCVEHLIGSEVEIEMHVPCFTCICVNKKGTHFETEKPDIA